MSEMNGNQNQDWRAQKEAERKETMHMINDAAFEIFKQALVKEVGENSNINLSFKKKEVE